MREAPDQDDQRLTATSVIADGWLPTSSGNRLNVKHTVQDTQDPLQPPRSVSFREAVAFWLKLGFISFGGPAGQISIMHQELVERRRWISERRFLHALNYCMLLPGPEAQQLATYIGWLMHRTWGGVVAGMLFVLPSLLILIGLSWLYVTFGEMPVVAGLFYGIKPAVTAIVVHATHSLTHFFCGCKWMPTDADGRSSSLKAPSR